MKDTFHFLYEQFSNLFDPNKALGAFLISLVPGLICTFIGGRRYERHKSNKIQADRVQGNICQNVRNSAYKQKNEKQTNSTEKNTIMVQKVKGDIWQDVER